MTPWRSRLDRADTHIADVEEMIADYLASSPFEYRRRTEPHPLIANWQTDVGRGYVTKQPPEQLPEALGDVVGSLKSALDRLVQALAKQGTATATQLTRTEFPVFVSDPSLNGQPFAKATAKHQLAGVADGARDFIESVQPYRRSPLNPTLDPLAMVHEIRRVDFHREAHITAAYGLVHGVHVLSAAGVGIKITAPEPGAIRPFKDGETLFTVRLQPQHTGDWHYDLDIQTRSYLALLYGDGGAGHEIIGLLHRLRDHVDEQVITPLEKYLE